MLHWDLGTVDPAFFLQPDTDSGFSGWRRNRKLRFGLNFIKAQRHLYGQSSIERYFLLFEAKVGDFYVRPRGLVI